MALVPRQEKRRHLRRSSCRSSVVEHSLGKGEVDSSILSGSTICLKRIQGLQPFAASTANIRSGLLGRLCISGACVLAANLRPCRLVEYVNGSQKPRTHVANRLFEVWIVITERRFVGIKQCRYSRRGQGNLLPLRVLQSTCQQASFFAPCLNAHRQSWVLSLFKHVTQGGGGVIKLLLHEPCGLSELASSQCCLLGLVGPFLSNGQQPIGAGRYQAANQNANKPYPRWCPVSHSKCLLMTELPRQARDDAG